MGRGSSAALAAAQGERRRQWKECGGGVAREAGPVLPVRYQPGPTPQSSAVTVTADHGTAMVRRPARQNKPAGGTIMDTYHP